MRSRHDRNGVLRGPLTPAQQGVFVMDRMHEGLGFANLIAEIELRGVLNVAALQAAFSCLIERHALLRSEAVEIDGHWHWRERARVSAPLRVVDVSKLVGRGEAQSICTTVVTNERTRSFKGDEPWLRAVLVKLAASEWVLILIRHHVASDGWSFALISAELQAIYNALVRGEVDVLPEPPQFWSYCRFVAAQSENVAAVDY